MSQRYATCFLHQYACSRASQHLRYRTTLRDRSQLLGTADYSTPPSSGRSSPFNGVLANGSSSHPMGQRYADDLESQNDEHLEGLTAKVKLLKDVSSSCCSVRLLLSILPGHTYRSP